MSHDSAKTPAVLTAETTLLTAPASRRQFIQHSGLLGAASVAASSGLLSLGLSSGAYAAGSDKPEKTTVKVGFIPLTDCAPIVMASKLGFDKKYGISIEASKEASWAGVRDKLINGELDAAHVLYGLIYGVHLGVAGPKKDMAVLMSLNNNGQSITLSKKLYDAGVTDGSKIKSYLASSGKQLTFAQTFPTGTHAMWLNYWLASHGVNPYADVKNIVVPPPQMVSNMQIGNMDGFCVGEPWGARAVDMGIGVLEITSQDVWRNHPEKVLGVTKEFVEKYPNTARAMIMAVLETCQWLDVMRNRPEAVKIISQKAYVNAPEATVFGRFLGRYDDGKGKTYVDGNMMRFFRNGQTTFPYLSDGMWFLTQHKRWGLLDKHPDYLAVAKQINQIGLYTDAAKQLGISVPSSPMRSSRLMDGKIWDGSNPAAYADSFKIKA
ncbi:MAG: CmpA/NrtA family ABC transporter substrate-binding protein [Pseudomonadota bacterium]|nr:CmpA/NrtA family ABC transporter substrate-binding protein [Pseudomonadota bacterium]